MSTKTLEDGDLCGIISKADITWNHRQTDGQLFGETYWDRTLSAWLSQFLATRYTWAFTQHIAWCQHRNNQFLRGIDMTSTTTTHTKLGCNQDSDRTVCGSLFLPSNIIT
eukprot:12768002-Ditylum_brightwellii.AAC.1